MARLITSVEVDPRGGPTGISVRARHELELDDATRVLLLDDRGWSSSRPTTRRSYLSVDEVEETARAVVGPDEPCGDWTAEDMVQGHWRSLEDIARSHGVTISARQLGELRHDVKIGPELHALLRNN